MNTGDRVIIRVPENPKLDGTEAIVDSVQEWGAFLKAPAAATGEFRAAWSEMEPLTVKSSKGKPKPAGEVCTQCGGVNMVRTGACLTCQDCGNNSGCG